MLKDKKHTKFNIEEINIFTIKIYNAIFLRNVKRQYVNKNSLTVYIALEVYYADTFILICDIISKCNCIKSLLIR